MKKVDVELKITNSLTKDDLVQVKLHFMELLTEKEKLTNAIFDDVVKELLKNLHIFFKKFINLDEYVKQIVKIPRTNVMSLFDCCREIKLKGKGLELNEEEKKEE